MKFSLSFARASVLQSHVFSVSLFSLRLAFCIVLCIGIPLVTTHLLKKRRVIGFLKTESRSLTPSTVSTFTSRNTTQTTHTVTRQRTKRRRQKSKRKCCVCFQLWTIRPLSSALPLAVICAAQLIALTFLNGDSLQRVTGILQSVGRNAHFLERNAVASTLCLIHRWFVLALLRPLFLWALCRAVFEILASLFHPMLPLSGRHLRKELEHYVSQLKAEKRQLDALAFVWTAVITFATLFLVVLHFDNLQYIADMSRFVHTATGGWLKKSRTFANTDNSVPLAFDICNALQLLIFAFCILRLQRFSARSFEKCEARVLPKGSQSASLHRFTNSVSMQTGTRIKSTTLLLFLFLVADALCVAAQYSLPFVATNRPLTVDAQCFVQILAVLFAFVRCVTPLLTSPLPSFSKHESAANSLDSAEDFEETGTEEIMSSDFPRITTEELQSMIYAKSPVRIAQKKKRRRNALPRDIAPYRFGAIVSEDEFSRDQDSVSSVTEKQKESAQRSECSRLPFLEFGKTFVQSKIEVSSSEVALVQMEKGELRNATRWTEVRPTGGFQAEEGGNGEELEFEGVSLHIFPDSPCSKQKAVDNLPLLKSRLTDDITPKVQTSYLPNDRSSVYRFDQ